jgi:hypothetical protein
MRRLWIIAAALAGLLVLQVAWASMHEEMPPADGEKLWRYITETHPYEQWSFYPGHEGMYEGTSPHGAYLKLYANDIAMDAARQGNPMPAGAILVKENYAEDRETLAAVTPMYKVEGYNPEAGNWFWAKYGPKGKIEAEGKVEGCIKCHSQREDRDYIFSQPK